MTRRSRRNAETTQALAVFAAGLEGRVQVQLDALSHMQATITELLVATRAEAERRESDLVHTLELVAGVCRQAVEVVEADRGEREAFLSLLSELVPQIQSRARRADARFPGARRFGRCPDRRHRPRRRRGRRAARVEAHAGGARRHVMSTSTSRWSIRSDGSILSIGSKGSILSIGSVGSILSVGSIGSACSMLSIGSFGSVGSVMSSRARWSLMSNRVRRGVMKAR